MSIAERASVKMPPGPELPDARGSVGAGSPTTSGLSAGVLRIRVVTWVIFISGPPGRMLHRTREGGRMADYLLTEKADGVAILTLNRPNQLNALNRQLSAELHEAVTRAVADDDVGCIVITGAGQKAFSAGGDIHEQREDDKKYTQAELDALGAERARGFYEIGACAKPTIGMINHLAPCAELRDKTLWLATMIAKNRRESVMGVKALLLQGLAADLEQQWKNERNYTTTV